MTEARISRSVPLDQLRGPETDVRTRRPEAAVKSLAASMGDPNVGQLQDVLVHPVDPDGLEDDVAAQDLDDLFRDGRPMRIVDGETRRLAAERLGWATLDCTIVPEPPEETVIAQLDANTERIEMGEFETVRALYDWREETGATLEEVGAKTGYSESYLSNVFSTMECPDWLVDPWSHPDHPLGTSHAVAVKSFLSSNTIEEYARAGGLDDQEAHERAVQDAKLMVDVQAEHDLKVGDFRQRCKRMKKQTIDQLEDQRTHEEKTAAGQARQADRDHSPAELEDPDPCLICGGDRPNRRKFAINVCREDYGMLSDMEANGEVLLAQAKTQDTQPQPATEAAEAAPVGLEEMIQAELGVGPEDAERAADQLRQATQQPETPAHE